MGLEISRHSMSRPNKLYINKKLRKKKKKNPRAKSEGWPQSRNNRKPRPGNPEASVCGLLFWRARLNIPFCFLTLLSASASNRSFVPTFLRRNNNNSDRKKKDNSSERKQTDSRDVCCAYTGRLKQFRPGFRTSDGSSDRY
ncbi:unnamed protein product [Ixodes pacificus]